MARNPLRLDPTRTALIRRQFESDINKRFATVQRNTWQYLNSELTSNAPFVFRHLAAKLKKFRAWLTQQVNQHILEANPATGEPKHAKPWTYKYIDSAYRKGVVQAYLDTHKKELGKPVAYLQGTQAQFLASSFAAPERRDKIEMLYTRSYEDLKGVTADMSVKMGRVLASGMANGLGPLKIAREMSKTVQDITVRRARVIARTETIHAHAEGTLDGLTDMGIQKVGVKVEFSTSNDDGVCPKCKKLEGTVRTVQAARGVIPAHPNCRCAWIPYFKLPKVKTVKP